MENTTAPQNFTAANTEYTTTNAGTVKLGTATYAVEIQTFHNGTEMIWLTGARGGVYHVRPYRNAKDGLCQVASWKTGMPLIQRGQEVRVIRIGDILEQA